MIEKEGKNMKKQYLGIISVMFLLFFIGLIFALDISVLINNQASTSIYYSNLTNRLFNFTVQAGTVGINMTNFTLSSGLSLVSGTNGTNALAINSNGSSSIWWYNNTGNLTNSGLNNSYWFNVSAADGNYYITINSTDNLGALNSTLVNITIDTLNPVLTLVTPVAYRNGSGVIKINATTVEANLNYTNISIYDSGGNILNSTINNSNNFNITLSVFGDGLYSVNLTSYDLAGHLNTTSVGNVRVDTTGPVVNNSAFVNPSSANTYSNSTGIISLNISIMDQGIGIISAVYFNITNASGYQKLFLLTGANGRYYSNLTGLNVSNTTIGDLSFPDGIYKIKLWANDTMNNPSVNVEIANITLDRIAPSSITPTAVTTGQTSINFSINAIDATSGISSCVVDRGTISGTASVSESGLICNSSYTYNLNCTDYAGNTNSTGIYSVLTSPCDVSSSGSGSGSSTSLSTGELVTGFTKSMFAGEIVAFRATNQSHTFILLSIKNDSVTVQVASVPQKAVLIVGEEKNFDLNADNTYEISVKLNSITGNKASITLKSISATIVLGNNSNTGNQVNPPVTNASSGAGNASAQGSGIFGSVWFWIVIAALVIAVIVWYVLARKQRY